MRILFIAPRLPFPLDTGAKIRTYNLIKQIGKRHTVDLVCFSFAQKDYEYVSEFEGMNTKVRLVPFQEKNIIGKIDRLLTSPLPFSIDKYCSLEMENTLLSLQLVNKYGLAHFDHLHMAKYRSCFDGLPCIVDEHNVEYKILERCAAVERFFFKKALYAWQAEKMKQFEAEQIKKFSNCLSVSPSDMELLKRLSEEKATVYAVPNGVDTEYFQPSASGKERQEEEALIFTGSMDWLPNEDAVLYFCREILPLIWKVRPDVIFYVVGKNPSKKIIQYGRDSKKIVVTGLVDDVRPYMKKAKIFVAPLRIGGGTRLKILEAMAMQKAVVATTLGCEGIDYTPDVNIALADTPAVFADKVVSLLNSGDKRLSLGKEGRKLTCQKYDWNIVGEKLNDIYEGISYVHQE